ncbi:hypothetical protein AAFF_G00349640 [Aldrovandia affinis]|uniref:HECT domain-containing protein n=1 Tax=Aldrovandia affinis TaxID=143900 RepID=A0AAD7SJW4_9TELE|nr:hypothetical protein AAFF_G00349640 [Aldrovandia affinis]
MICWGESTLKELGLNSSHHDVALRPTQNQETPGSLENAKIATVSVGKGVVAVVRENGTGAFCLRDEMGDKKNKRKPRHLALWKHKIDTLSCGAFHIVMVSETGNVFQLNCEEKPNIPRPLNAIDRQVIQVACGDHHTIALSKDGQLFTWGSNSNGQLGLGNDAPSTKTPQLLYTLSGIPLVMVTAGRDHSFTLSISGTVFGWGKNNAGQLGLGDKTDRYDPIPVKSLHLKRTVSISCGDEHTASLTKGGLVFTFGSGKYGQLGHNSNRDELQPRLVAELWGSRVTQIACGRHHSLAYVSSLKTIYAFGCGEQGQLGSEQASNQNVPLPVQLSSAFDSDHGIGTIFAGGNQSFYTPIQGSEGSPETRPCPDKMISTLDDKLINKWMSDTKPWKKIKREIINIFSSDSSLNGSFLHQSDDKHYQTTLKNSGLDLSLARQAFEKLAKSERVLTEIVSAVQNKLIPSLYPAPAGVEGLRVYLILPELLRVLPVTAQRVFCMLFAHAILKLQPDCLKILEGLWSSLPEDLFQSLVNSFQSVSSWFICQRCLVETERRVVPIRNTLEVLQKLFVVNFKRNRKIHKRKFYITQIKQFFLSDRRINPGFEIVVRDLSLYPGIFDKETKYLIFGIKWFTPLEEAYCHYGHNDLFVNRKTILADTIKQLQGCYRNYSCPLKVTFAREDGVDEGGVSQEFFTILVRQFCCLDPSMIEMDETTKLSWFCQQEDSEYSKFVYLGIVCGMALFNDRVANFCFPLALFKKLLGFEPTLEDLKELSPVVAGNVEQVLYMDEDVLEALYLDFTVDGHDLVPNGEDILVTNFNRKQYVEAYVEFVFNKSVTRQFDSFLRGFTIGCPKRQWNIFLPEELMALLQGNVDYDWDELKKNTKYEAYKPTDENIQNFWTVFSELSEEQKKNFMFFMTGTERLLVSKTQMTIVNSNKSNPDDYSPQSSTCFCKLYLPNYSSIQILRDKFVHAISFCEEFGLE